MNDPATQPHDGRASACDVCRAAPQVDEGACLECADALKMDMTVRRIVAQAHAAVLAVADAGAWQRLGYVSAENYIASIAEPSPYFVALDDLPGDDLGGTP